MHFMNAIVLMMTMKNYNILQVLNRVCRCTHCGIFMVPLLSITIDFAKFYDSYIWCSKIIDATVSKMEIKKLS